MRILTFILALLALAYTAPVHAQNVNATTVAACGTPNNSPIVTGSYPITQDLTGKLCTASSAAISGSTSNATSGVATSSTNLPDVSYTYGFNGVTWDQLQVDASKYLKVNCVTGCAGGSSSNASSGVATSSTNGATNAWLYGFNGTTWDQLQVDGSKFLKMTLATALPAGSAVIGHVIVDTAPTTVITCALCSTAAKQPALGTAGAASTDVLTVQGIASMTALKVDGSGVTQPVSGTVTASQGTAANLNATVVGTGTFAVQAAQSGTWTVQPGNTANTTAWKVDGSAVTQPVSGTVSANPAPVTSGGLSICYLQATASSNSTNCKASAGQIYHIRVFNNSANIAYLHLINTSSAPTCSSATTVDQIMVPGVTGGTGAVVDIAMGEAFSTGISFCFSGGIANNDNTSVAASAYTITILYK